MYQKSNKANNLQYELVSVIIPTHNRCTYLMKAINSVINQTYKKIEIIVVDNDSTDNTKKAVSSLIKTRKIKYIYANTKHSPAYSRNIGIKNANGNLIAFLDDDDQWNKEKLDEQLPLFLDSNICLVFSNAKICGEKKKLHKPIAYGEHNCNNPYKQLINENFITTSSVVVRKNALVNEGYFDEKLFSLEDYDMWIRIAHSHKIDFVNKDLVRYYIHENSLSNVDKIKSFKQRCYLYYNLLKKNKIKKYRFLILKKYLKNRIYLYLLCLSKRFANK